MGHNKIPVYANINLDVKGHAHIEVKNECNKLFQGDIPMCQFVMPISKSKDNLSQTQIHGENIILISRSKYKVIHKS